MNIEKKAEEVYYSCVVPVYNEEGCLYKNAHKLIDAFKAFGRPFELIISDDGSTDGTPEIARNLSTEDASVRSIRYDTNMGRGEALVRGFKACKGKILAFMDIDLSVDLRYLPTLFNSIEQGADVATGSRWVSEAVVSRGLSRTIVSFFYNFMVRLLFDSEIKDHQCGFKAFKRESILGIISDMDERSDRSWAWDTEVLVRAQQKGYKIVEFPVEWQQGGSSKFRYIKDSWTVFLYLIKLKNQLSSHDYGEEAG